MSEVSSPSLFVATSSAAPTAFQPQPPTYVPSEAPSAAPSVEAFYFTDGSLVTQLYINQERSMNNVEHALFVGIMEGHTESIGNNLTSPFIKTYCTILNQVYGTSGDTIVLQVSYHMNYTTKYGYDIYEYPELFRIFMNENNATTLEKFVDLIDVPEWSYIQEVGTTVAVTEDNIMELMATYAPQSAPQPPFSAEGKGSRPGNSLDGSHPSSSMHNSSLDSDLPSSSSSSIKREDTLVGVLLGFSIVILLTVVAGFIRVYRKKKQEQQRRDEGGIILTTDTEDQHAVEYSIDPNAAAAAAAAASAAVMITNSLDQPPSEETAPSSSTPREKEIVIKDDDSSIMNEAIFTFALPIDVSDAEKGIITALDVPTAMMVDGETHHDRFSSGLSPLSFLIETESIDEVAVGGNHEEIATLGAPLSSNNTERGTVISAMETTPTAQHLQVSMSHDLNRSEMGTCSVSFAPEVAQTVVLEQFDDSRGPLEVSDSYETEECFVTEEVTSPQLDHGTFQGANLMAIGSDSLSSESREEESLASQPSTGDVVDEFDKYRDHLLDVLTEEVEAAVDSVHVPLRLAVAQLFTDGSEQGAPSLDLSWIGGEDLGSIEASCLCHACAWEQNNDSSTGQTFYEDLLNKIVLIVHHGLLTPHDGARILHGCASIVGLTLLKELPNTTAVIQGLISTNELAHGHHLLVSAFEQFGEIVDASICPQNRAFGFVRFANSESIDKVLNEPSVVIQDVTVSITSLLR